MQYISYSKFLPRREIDDSGFSTMKSVRLKLASLVATVTYVVESHSDPHRPPEVMAELETLGSVGRIVRHLRMKMLT